MALRTFMQTWDNVGLDFDVLEDGTGMIGTGFLMSIESTAKTS